jgi:hypothetical protein
MHSTPSLDASTFSIIPYIFNTSPIFDGMAPFPARSVDSTMVTEDDDPTITVGGLANDNQEPELVNQSPIAPLAMKPVLTIDKVVAGQAVSFEALPPFLPSANGEYDAVTIWKMLTVI